MNVGEDKPIDILRVKCDLLKFGDKTIGWYWFCVSRFEGVLKTACWQRGLRLRKANIQIGESDCLSNQNRPKKLWREDRGNNYFLGEVHAIDPELIPNSRRDYFNQNIACKNFENAISNVFLTLHDVYHKASEIRSEVDKINKFDKEKKAFEHKEKSGGFIDKRDRDTAIKKLISSQTAAEKAQKKIEKIKLNAQNDEVDNDTTQVFIREFASKSKRVQPLEITDLATPKNKPSFLKSEIPDETWKVLEKVFSVLQMAVPQQFEELKNKICKKFAK